MQRRWVGIRASLPAIFSGGMRRIHAATSISRFAICGEVLSSRSRYHDKVYTSVISPFKSILNTGSNRKLHASMASPIKLLDFPRNEVDTAKNRMTLSASSTEEDEFTELGSLTLKAPGVNLTTKGEEVEDLSHSCNIIVEGVDEFSGLDPSLSGIKEKHEGILNGGSYGKHHACMASLNRTLEFSTHEVSTVKNQKTSYVSSTDEDEFAELGCSGLEGSAFNLTTKGEVIEDLRSSCNDSIDEGDEFAGLGPPLSGGTPSEFNLTTEKREDGVYPGGKLWYNRSPKAKKSSRSVKPTKDHRSPDKNFELEGQKSKLNSEIQTDAADNDESNTAFSHCVSVCGIPQSITLRELKAKLSEYGEILSTSMKVVKGGVCTCNVEFKDMESKRMAVAAEYIMLKNHRIPIRENIVSGKEFHTVRITNVNRTTTEGVIHMKCTEYGEVLGLVRNKEGGVDVRFKVQDISTSKRILMHLNSVCLDDSHWSAMLVPRLNHQNDVSVTDASDSHIIDLLSSTRKQNPMQGIYLEDLEDLHHAVSHLKDHPSLSDYLVDR